MDKSPTINPEQYFKQIEDLGLRETAFLLHQFLLTYDTVSCRMTYNIPFYYGNRWICYLNLTKSGQLELAFTYGCQLKNVHGLLKSNGRKQVAGTFIEAGDEIPFEVIDELMQEAIGLDRSKGKSR